MSCACDHPEKDSYETKGDALTAWRGIREKDRSRAKRKRRAPTLTPYRCSAGRWHLGRDRKRGLVDR